MKTTIKDRIENAYEAFFDNERNTEKSELTLAENSTIAIGEGISDFEEKRGLLITILRQVFLFLPGTFVLFFMSLGFVAVTIAQPNGETPRFELGLRFFMFVASILMIWGGLGDLRKLNHALIPASVIAVGALFGTIFAGISITSPWLEHFITHDGWFALLLPIALIIPILTKSWVDNSDEKDSQ